MRISFRYISIIFACVTFCCYLNSSAFAEENILASGAVGNNVTWTLDNSGLLTVSGSGNMLSSWNPADYAWNTYRDSINSVVIQDGVTSVGAYAFLNFFELTDVSISGTVQKIGDHAFGGCGHISRLIIQEGVASIGNAAFAYCNSLENVVIPSSITDIGENAFQACGTLSKINIPKNTKNMGYRAFQDCEKLLSAGPMNSDSNIIFEWEYEIPASAFSFCNYLKSIILPDEIRTIGDHAFSNCSELINITLPQSIENIGDGAFYGCSALESVMLPEGVISIGPTAFSNCSNLVKVILPSSLSDIGRYVFSDCNKLQSAGPIGSNSNIEFSMTEAIPELLFHGCNSLLSIIFPDGVKAIKSMAFAECISLENIEIPSSITEIDYCAFNGCSGLKSISIAEGVVRIGSGAFGQCSNLTNVIIPASVNKIEASAFAGTGIISFYVDSQNSSYCNIDGVLFNKEKSTIHSFPSGRSGAYAIPEGTKTIGESAFSGCDRLIHVTIPEGVTDVKDGAFRNCTAMRSIIIPRSVAKIGAFASEAWSSETEIYYAGTQNQWTQIQIIFGGYYGAGYYGPLCNIELKNAKKHYNVVPDFILPAAVKEIEEDTFAGCAFTFVMLPEQAVSVGYHAFADCPNLLYIYISETTKDIDPEAFGYKKDFTIFGKNGSPAEYYAEENDFAFVGIP